jgi:hypothetical protein
MWEVDMKKYSNKSGKISGNTINLLTSTALKISTPIEGRKKKNNNFWR